MSQLSDGIRKTLPKHVVEQSDKRLTVCNTCDRFNQENKRCAECGCFMEYKTLLPHSKCPIGKW